MNVNCVKVAEGLVNLASHGSYSSERHAALRSECMTSDIDKVTKYSSRHPPIHSAEKPLSVRKCHVLFIFNVSVTHNHMYNVNHFKIENIDIIPLKLLSHFYENGAQIETKYIPIYHFLKMRMVWCIGEKIRLN